MQKIKKNIIDAKNVYVIYNQQDKDKAQLGPAKAKVEAYMNGIIDIEKICAQYNISISSKKR